MGDGSGSAVLYRGDDECPRRGHESVARRDLLIGSVGGTEIDYATAALTTSHGLSGRIRRVY